MSVVDLVGLVLSAIVGVLSAIHVYWAFGGKWGTEIAIPTKDGAPLFEPSPAGTMAVAVALGLASGILLGRVYGMDAGASLGYWSVWGIAVVFFLRAIGDFKYVGFFKTCKNTPFAYWDTRLFSPLSLGIAIGAALMNLA